MKNTNVVCIWQGLGNQMFQYAFAKSLEIHTGKRIWIDAESLQDKFIGEELGSNTVREYGLDHFRISLKQINKVKRRLWFYTRGDKWYYEIIKTLIEKGKYPYKYFSQKGFCDISVASPSFEEIENHVYIKGWFQAEAYFTDIRDILLQEFTLEKELTLPKNMEEAIRNTESVSVHIRRGDYKKGNMVLEQGYYKEAMRIIAGRVENPTWIVFSDDMEYVQKNYCFDGQVFFVDHSYGLMDYEQLILMSKCKHNIIANSTFSWWGAWLNQNADKCVIAPDKWFKSQRNIVPKEWIKIESAKRV